MGAKLRSEIRYIHTSLHRVACVKNSVNQNHKREHTVSKINLTAQEIR